MLKNLRFYARLLVLIGIAVLPLTTTGQDLGSSTGLFKTPKSKKPAAKIEKKPAPKKLAPKKSVPKPSATTAKKSAPQSAARRTRAAAAKPKAKPSIKKQKPTPPETPPESATEVAATDATPKPPVATNLIITVGDKTSGDYNEFFEKFIEEGNAARDARNYVKAEADYLRARSLQSKDSRAIYGLGNLYSDQQRWEEAERAYRTALEIEPSAPESYIALSFVLTQPIIGANLADRYSEAETLARKAIELDAKNAFAYDQLGVALELGGKIGQETEMNYRRAIELEPSFALAYAHLGRLLNKIGKSVESNAAYSQSIKLAADVPTMILVADVMQSQQKYAESEQLLRRALKEDEKNPTALFLLGRALTVRESYDEAEKVLRKSAEVSPKSFVSYTLLGSMYVRRGKFADAEKYLIKAVRVVSPNEKKRLAQEFETLGDGFLRLGKDRDAARAFRQAVALDKEKNGLAEKLAKAEGV